MYVWRGWILGCWMLIGCGLLWGCGGGSNNGFTQPPTNTLITPTAGGTLVNNNALLSVPAGAVTAQTLVTLQPATGYPADTRLVSGTAYTYLPTDTPFNLPVQIRITYDAAKLPAGAVESSLQLYKVSGNAWTPMRLSTLDTTAKTVTGSDTTLGTYAILANTINSGASGSGTILFTSTRNSSNGIHNLFSMNSDGSSVNALTSFASGQSADTALYKPDGSAILFSVKQNNGEDIYIAKPDGASATLLLGNNTKPDGSHAVNRLPAYSADGTKIAFASDVTGVEQIYVMNADGSAATALTTYTSNQVFSVDFTRDGKIAFSNAPGTNAIYYSVINTDGSGLTSSVDITTWPRPWWSFNPTGQSLVYTSRSNASTTLQVAKADGTNPQTIAILGNVTVNKVRSTLDGKLLVFDSRVSTNNANTGVADIYIVAPDGTGQRKLTDGTSNNRFQDVH